MLYLIICLTGVFICDGLAFGKSPTTIGTEKEQDFIAEQRILQDLIYLGTKTENITKDVEQLVNFYALNYYKFMEHQYEGNEYRSMLIQILQSRHCYALKNNFEMLTSHVKLILQQCYERAQLKLKSLLDRATRLRKAIMNEIAKWATNDTRQDQYSTPPLPILLRDARESARNMSSNAITERIEFFNVMIERFQIGKKLTEIETNFNAKLCGVVANTYEEEIKSLLNALKRCLAQGPAGIATVTLASVNTSDNNFNQDIKELKL